MARDPVDRRAATGYSRRDVLRLAGIGLGAVALAGCGGGDEPAAAPGDAQAGEDGLSGTVNVALFGAPGGEQELLGAPFQERFPGADVQFTPIQGTDWEEFFSKLLTSIAAGNVPDVTFVATEGLQLFAAQLAAPIDDYVTRDAEELQEYFSDVHPALIEAMMYEGSLYELPHNFNAANMYYNTGVFAEAGHEHPPPDWDKDTFHEIARDITGEGSSARFGYAWINRLWGSWMPWIFVNDGNLFTEDRAPGGEWLWEQFYADDPAAEGRSGGWRWQEPTANSPEVVEALEFVVQLQREGITPAVEVGGGQTLQGFFADGQLAMTPAGGFWAGGLNQAGMAPGAFDVQLFPRWRTQRHQFGTAGYVLMEGSANPDLAWEWLKYTVDPESMELTIPNNSTTPSRRSMMTAERYAPTGPEHWQVFYDTLDEHPDTAPIPAPPESNAMTIAFVRYTGLAMSEEITPQEAMDGLQSELEQLMG